MLVFLLSIMYIISVVVCHGVLFGYIQNKYHTLAEAEYYSDFGISILLALVLGLLGPFGIGIIILLSDFGRFGLKLK